MWATGQGEPPYAGKSHQYAKDTPDEEEKWQLTGDGDGEDW